MNKLRSTVLSVIAWFFGVVFIFGALGAFLGGSLIAGLLMLVAGVLFLPPIKRLILDRKPTLSKGKITIAGAVLAVISMFFVPTDNENQASTSESTAVETKQEVVKEKETIEKTEVDKPIEKQNEILPTTADDEQIEMVKPSTVEKRQDIDPIKARAILDKVDQEVEAVKGFNVEDRTEAAKKSRRMKALLEEDTAPFGDENEKVGRLCDATRRQAFTYWLQVMTEKSKEDAQISKDFLQYYQDSKKPCLDAIKDFENS
ncbi:DUF308 domain-containing protein [Psychrobacter sp. SWN149]|uniref:DUF308 domain-containing protein n=1 Tax=Psychrobacter sp. SWN149 TaxID=2792057 RepID=UPI0018CD3656|nr:DUF308 domain-containing protein [Psychrobacter sp. SWN149]MBH0007698.1 hypothetical protein [Psychrobacter sp. SWN149]